jgi:hypothetical protein
VALKVLKLVFWLVPMCVDYPEDHYLASGSFGKLKLYFSYNICVYCFYNFKKVAVILLSPIQWEETCKTSTAAVLILV